MRTYLQIFSMTDHTAALQGRYQGPYRGTNAELQTSEFDNGTLRLSTETKYPAEPVADAAFDAAQVVMAYRHSDTGALSGTSETLYAVGQVPWRDIPGMEILEARPDGTLVVKLWMQEITLPPRRVTRVHFAKTIVYLKNFGAVETVERTASALAQGPAHLHAEEVDDNLTIAPDTGSALVVKMGQETEH